MTSFYFWLVVAVAGLAFALGFLGVGKVAATAIIVAFIVLAFVMWALNQLANSIVDGHGPCSGGEERET